METFKTQKDFLAALEKELKNFNVSERNEILLDFQRHFEDSLSQGLREEEICKRLGDLEEIIEIARQYADSETTSHYCPITKKEPSEKGGDSDYKAYHKTFTSSYFEIDISTIIAKTVIGLSGDNNTYIDYQSNRPGAVLSADIVGVKLEVKERIEGLGSWLFSFGSKSFLKVLVPKAVYDKITISGVSANTEIDRLQGEVVDIHSTSGNISADIWGKNLELHSVSGKMTVSNCTDNSTNFLKIRSVSASINISDFMTSEFDVSSTSGKVYMTGVGGRGKVNIISGKVNLDYSLWNDSLGISAVSGIVKITAPENTGVNLSLTKMSGLVKYKLSADKGSCCKNGDYSFGGTNRQNVTASLTSGVISIADFNENPTN